MRKVVVLGNVTLDIRVGVDWTAVLPGTQMPSDIAFIPGGGAANVSLRLRASRIHSQMLGCVGDDDPGRLVSRLLPQAPIVRVRSTTEVSVVVAGGERTIFNQQGSASLPAEIALRRIPPASVLVVAYLNCSGLPIAQTPRFIKAARHRAQLIVAAMNGVFSEPRRRASWDALPSVDVAVMNRREAMWLTETGTLTAAAAVLARRTRAAVVTNGAHPAIVIHDGRRRSVPVRQLRVRRTLGAGDAFLGGLAGSLARDSSDLDLAIRAGLASAGRWVRGTPPEE